ncbi:MAG: oligosaccharide flippase family protein [Chloroflexi bacterium]|nr:oligosaccharide flippase family protein [Chloroflexota bacterium]
MFARLRALYHRVFETEILRRIVRNSSYLVSATVFAAALGMLQNVFQFRVLGPAGVGLLGALATLTNVLNRLTAFRIDELVVRYVRLYQERGETEKAAAVFKLAALLESLGALAAFALIVALAPLGVRLFSDQPGTEGWFILYGALVLINLFFDSSDGVLQVFDRFNAKAVIDGIQSVIRLGGTLIVFFTGGGLFEIILAELAGRLARALGMLFMALQTAHRQWGPGWWRTPFSALAEDRRSLLTFAFSANLSATVSLVAKDSEDLWVNAFLGNTVGGFYNAARNLIGFLQIPISPLASTTYPELSRSVAQKDWHSVRHVLRRGSFMAGLYSLPITLLLILFGRPVITLYAGEDFLPAYEPLVILLIGYLFVNVFYWNRVALLAFNRPVYPTLVNFVAMLFKVGGIFLLAERYGAAGFAALLSGYYIFTISAAVLRTRADLRRRLAATPSLA